MAQESVTQQVSKTAHRDEHSVGKHLLGPILCWAVVFADIGTSVYYVPGILYGNVGSLAGFFVFLTMTVFMLLTLKYAEVTHRYPQGGGVVTVGALALNKWFGALGGMFILVDYFLTAAISSVSGMQYLSVVIPAIGPSVTVPVFGPVQVLLIVITICVLVLLGILNWVGISESAKVSFVGAVIAFVSDIAILITVFTHISFGEFLSLFAKMFEGRALTPVSLLIGYAGSFLAFSGLESISQLSPVMRTPRKKTAGIALLLVVLTIGITSPLLTMFSTLLLPKSTLDDPVLSTQVISLLGGRWGTVILQTEVAISASALLVFASNTAIIGTYHVFIALSRMEFFPSFVLKRNKLRGTPHYSILLATGIPILILIIVLGNINILGDMYAFGLLGAFSLTCLGLDVVRYRERKAAKEARRRSVTNEHQSATATNFTGVSANGRTSRKKTLAEENPSPYAGPLSLDPWHTFKFYIGILTTFLVVLAWTTNLIAKPLATAFGGTVTVIGMGIAYYIHRQHKAMGRVPIAVTHVEERLPGSILAVLTSGDPQNEAVMRTAIDEADGHPVVFLYVAPPQQGQRPPRMFELVDPYLDDQEAKETFGRAEHLAQKAGVARRYVYQQERPGGVSHIWQVVHPHDTVVAADETAEVEDINPDRIRYETTSEGKVAHLIKRW